MDEIHKLGLGLHGALAGPQLLACLAGCLLGLLTGVLHRVRPAAVMALLLPLVPMLETDVALMLLVGVHCGARYGAAAAMLMTEPAEPTVFRVAPWAADAQALTRQGYTPVLATQTPGGSTEDELVEMLVERGVTGIIFVSGLHADSTADMGRYERLRAQGVPYVLINGFSPLVQAPFVSPDDRGAVRLAVTHLAELGHERIGLAVGPKRYVPVLRKIEGFVASMGEVLGMPAEEAEQLIQHSLFTLEGGQAAATALIEQGCTAVVCASDMMALGAIRAVRRRGLAVPRDVSVVGFDDSPLIAFTDPPLTTIRQPVTAMGQAAVHALLEEVGGTPAPHSEFVFLPELVVRGSTAAGPKGQTGA